MDHGSGSRLPERRLSVLLLEDSPIQAKLVQQMLAEVEDLTGTEHVVTHLESLDMALQFLQGGAHFHVAVLDLTLPDADGIDTYLRFAEAAPDVPVVVMSASESAELTQQALREGAQDYVRKGSFSGEELVRAMHHAIERHSLLNALRDTIDERDAAAQRVRDLVGMATHELLNPMGAISGFTKLMLAHWDRLSAEQLREFVERIDVSSDRSVAVARSLLAMTRIEEPGIIADIGDVDMVVTLHAAIFGSLLEVDDVRVRISADRTGPDGEDLVTARADAVHVDAILGNLLGNAAKYGAPPVQVQLEDDGSRVRVAVTDAGAGVDPDVLPLLFNRFAKGTGDERGDNGLGLHLSREMARASGGDLTYDPASTTFTLELATARD